MCWCSLYLMFLYVLNCFWFKYVFSNYRSRPNRALFVRWWIRVYNISHKREVLSTLEYKFVLTHGQVMSPQGCQKDFLQQPSIQCQFHVLFDPINYAQHTARIQYCIINHFKQASVLFRNLKKSYNIRNGSVMFKVSIEIMGFQFLCHFQTLYFIFKHRSERQKKKEPRGIYRT